ncbi:hypothetical protein PHYSODRAFT_470960 [Phytophthora sojae]|uniref:Glycosyl transferase family 1 domain-containing protein n=1 Tax=Phytophthora sojae (strain P6497) TaxID=1094619 RepID=G4YJG4_PHYSP|nr:hypothetical protein PHYSODRAFT_470960 [Phytophthora sojae]EGZ29919.1 hypothetical protein PHYSODRAFT_470960 [Phytophthora sojae]|eukprot:XP_009517194.1 hypothetical protein PHYSODRAFT_470960 [Phytophthora sojae]
MMSEMDAPPTSRLRRRSFFEGMENESTTTESITLNEIDLASAASASGAVDQGESYGAANSPLKPGKVSPSKPKTSMEDSDLGCAKEGSRMQQVLKLLQDVGVRVATWLQLPYVAWAARFPAAASKVEQWRLKTAWLVVSPKDWIKRWKGDPTAPVKYWVYPTHWLTYASVSLVLLQILIFWKFQTVSLDLRVHECVFRERLLASADLMQPGAVSSVRAQPAAAALRFLERRFEQQYSPGARQPGQARLPWTCLAVIPTGSDNAMAQATELAFLWPRSQVVAANAHAKVASRVHVAIGASPLDRATETAGATSAGVFAAMFPLSAMRPALFAPRFPDLVLVKTEFALRQMLKFRQERQEEREHRGRAGVKAANGLGRTSPADMGTLDLAASHFGVYLLKTSVPDIYNRHIRKKWDDFLHVVVVGDADKKEQFTEELLSAWVAHPEWPMLHVRFQRSMALCGSFQRVLSSMLKDYEANAEAAEAAEAAANPDGAAEDWLEGLDSPKKQGKRPQKRQLNVDLVCEEEANSPEEITRLKNTIGIHLFPVPPEVEKYEDTVLESAAVGAVTVTYNTPIMQEWVPDSCGLRLPSVHVTSSEIEQAADQLLKLDRVSRVAAGRAARVHYLRMRTHYLSAVAALDAAVCEGDSDDMAETQSEIGQHRRRKVEVETLRAFLY